ncbi:unnamed protein product [Prorocentrum cordatum]|uniref:Uncharacterized protein n=1 Tax=Prorocentrum cordatum TaxID=2364126 RepID=A0ABN9RDN1_9DINO|nr:unnamed protein product [Polarella glacialis]
MHAPSADALHCAAGSWGGRGEAVSHARMPGALLCVRGGALEDDHGSDDDGDDHDDADADDDDEIWLHAHFPQIAEQQRSPLAPLARLASGHRGDAADGSAFQPHVQ